MDADRERIEQAMLAAVATPNPYLTEIASHLIIAGGKRLRPVLAVTAGRLTGEVTDEVIQGGVSCELVHLGSLYHDDVMDEAETRRGVETVNAQWGNLQAIVAGDFLLARASEISASLGAEPAELISFTLRRLCEGQLEELERTYDVARSEESYLSSILGKTASLYGAAARIGGLAAGLDRSMVDALTDYGHAYGTVFQIIDDVLDLTSTAEALGKPAGHDMEEGVYTLPVLRTLQSDGGDELANLLGRPLNPDERDRALAIVRAGDGIASALETAHDFADQAAAACDRLGDSMVIDVMRAAPRHLLDEVMPVK